MDSLGPLLAIVWAQWHTARNFFLRANKGGLIFKWLMGLLWYGAWAIGAAGAGFLVSGRVPAAIVERALPGALFLIFFFWQLFPIILASQGAFLDMRRLLVYPIPTAQLFLLEVVLRVTTALEMVLVCAGLIAGLLLNHEVPLWGPLAIAVFMVFNLLLATGVKSLMQRLFKRRGVRELMMVAFLGLSLLPQFFAASLQDGGEPNLRFVSRFGALIQMTPWVAAGRLALGKLSGLSVASLLGAVVIAYIFARLHFQRTLLIDEASGEPARNEAPPDSTWLDKIIRWPSSVWLDPLAVLVEKDLRILSRSPRFRLIFMMGSTFGALLWLPQVLRDKSGWLARNYITMATLYGILVLGEVLYWNVFGFERAGAQQWFVTPIRFREVLRAKNMVAVLFTLFAVLLLSAIAFALPISAGLPQFADALAAASVFIVFIMGGGNLTSVYMPRPIDPEQAWRNNSSKTQFVLLLAYPVLSIPVTMAHLARWATESYWAYHAVLAVSLIVALCFYHVATDEAVEVAELRKENIVAALSRSDGPVSIST